MINISQLFTSNNRSVLPNQLTSEKFFYVLGLHALIHSLLLLGFVFYQFVYPVFLNSDAWVFIYLSAFIILSVDFLFFYFYERIKHRPFFYGLYLSLDAILMTICLSVVFPVLDFVLVFIYLLQITSAGVAGRYKGAFAQGLLVSFLFSWILVLNVSQINQPLLMSFVLSNMGFLLVSGLSGFFGTQLDKMNWFLKTADQNFVNLENLNKIIVENIKMGLLIMDKNLSVSYANKAALSILNLTSSVSVPVKVIFPELQQFISSDRQTDLDYFKTEYIGGDEKKMIELFFSPLSEEQRDNKKYLVLFQDCSKKHQLEQAKREKEKFISIGRMATRIAHELRNPLASISGSVQLLNDDNKGQARDENNRLKNITLSEISRLNRMIEDLLNYASSSEEGVNLQAQDTVKPLRDVLVNPILEDMEEQIQVHPRWSHICSHFELHSKGHILINADHLKQIFWNLVKNSCESMESMKEGKLTVESFDDNEWVVVRIKDTGTGINEKDKNLIFEAGYSTKEKGTGLGLSIVSKLVPLYKGSIICESANQSTGAVFTIRFPIQPNHVPGERTMRKSA